MLCGRNIGLMMGVIAFLSPLHAAAQSNPWITPYNNNRSDGMRPPEQQYSNDQNTYGPDTMPWQQRATRSQAPNNYERRRSDGRYVTGSVPQADRQSSYQRQGRFVPSYATGRFGPPQPRRSETFSHYPPPGYEPPNIFQQPKRPRQWPDDQRSRGYERQYAPRGWPPRNSRSQNPWQDQTSQYRSAPQTWSDRARAAVAPRWRDRSDWSVNPQSSGTSPGFQGPSTFGNPFGSPFGGLVGPYGFPGVPGYPSGGLW